MDRVKVAVTGAAGQIGYSLLFRIANGEMFGTDVDIDLSLLEIPQGIPAARGVVMELLDCAFPRLKNISVSDDPNIAFKEADWAFLVGSIPRGPGMERGDLLKVNGGIFSVQGKALDKTAKPTCRVLVVGNPCNTNAFIAKENCVNIPAHNFFALTMLDQNRAAAQLALKAGVDVRQISHLAIWGNHSATQYPDFYNAKIKGVPVPETINDVQWLQNDFIEIVQKRGAAIIQARGKSSAASAASAVVDTVKALNMTTPEGECFSVAVTSDGSYGIEEGLIFSFPVRVDEGKWSIVQGISLAEFAKEKISITEKELLEERAAVTSDPSLI